MLSKSFNLLSGLLFIKTQGAIIDLEADRRIGLSPWIQDLLHYNSPIIRHEQPDFGMLSSSSSRDLLYNFDEALKNTEQRSALRDYMDEGYKEINEALRNVNGSIQDIGDGQIRKLISNIIDALDTLMSLKKGRHVTNNIQVYRYQTLPEEKLKEITSYVGKNHEYYEPHQFFSTSLRKGGVVVNRDFLPRNHKRILFDIFVIDGCDLSEFTAEQEILLKPDAVFKVTEVSEKVKEKVPDLPAGYPKNVTYVKLQQIKKEYEEVDFGDLDDGDI